jgi:hypothetical protein
MSPVWLLAVCREGDSELRLRELGNCCASEFDLPNAKSLNEICTVASKIHQRACARSGCVAID